MKKLRECVRLALGVTCLMVTSTSAARSLQKGDVTLRMLSGAENLIRITPTSAPAGDPALVCKAKGHSWKQTSKKNATCSRDGSIIYMCSVCGKTKSETIDATGDHDYSYCKQTEATCTAYVYRISKCSCGDEQKEPVRDPLGHSFGSWKEVSRTKLERKCSRCGKTETKANLNGSILSSAVAVKQTPTPKLIIVGKVTATLKPAGKTEAKATATHKKKTSSSGSKSTTAYEFMTIQRRHGGGLHHVWRGESA